MLTLPAAIVVVFTAAVVVAAVVVVAAIVVVASALALVVGAQTVFTAFISAQNVRAKLGRIDVLRA